MGPHSRPVEFILRGRGREDVGTFGLGLLRAPARECTFRGTSATTGSLAVISSSER